MQFRCVVLITLWTMFSGPIFGPPVNSAPARHTSTARRTPPPPPPAHAPRHR